LVRSIQQRLSILLSLSDRLLLQIQLHPLILSDQLILWPQFVPLDLLIQSIPSFQLALLIRLHLSRLLIPSDQSHQPIL
jgi:hypothetical protein